ncbi:MAG: glycosyltransferase [Thermoleophilia bacterium]|nr:glycosyltransferase [Thermoleophilia bacterium]
MDVSGKKILLVHSSAALYGSDRCLLGIAAELRSRGYQVHAALPNYGRLADKLAIAGVRVHIMETVVFRRDIFTLKGMAKMAIKSPVAIWRLRKFMRQEHFDLVHTNTGVTVGGAVAARLAGVPHVWHFRDILSEFGFFFRFYQPLVRFLSTRSIFITKAVRDQFSDSRLKEAGVVIYDGVPVDKFIDTPPEKIFEKTVIVTVGRLAPYKGQDVLIEALGRAARDGLNLKAFIIGDVYGGRHSFREGLEKQARELGLEDRIEFTGFQEHVQPFLEECNIFIMPSVRQEPLGIVMLEAMAAGRAVIASDGGGAPEIIENGKNGILVRCGDPVSMAQAIIRLANDNGLRKKLSANGKMKVLEKFSEEASATAIVCELEKVLKRNNHGATFGGNVAGSNQIVEEEE